MSTLQCSARRHFARRPEPEKTPETLKTNPRPQHCAFWEWRVAPHCMVNANSGTAISGIVAVGPFPLEPGLFQPGLRSPENDHRTKTFVQRCVMCTVYTHDLRRASAARWHEKVVMVAGRVALLRCCMIGRSVVWARAEMPRARLGRQHNHKLALWNLFFSRFGLRRTVSFLRASHIASQSRCWRCCLSSPFSCGFTKCSHGCATCHRMRFRTFATACRCPRPLF